MQTEFLKSQLAFNIANIELDISAIHRDGDLSPIVFLHGFGSTKEEYADHVRNPAFNGHPFLAYDAPGFGESHCTDLSKLSIPILVETAIEMIDLFNYDHFHLVGHSMGGLTALMLAHQYPDRVLSFTNIKGNLAPEDCFLSRQIFDYPSDDDERFFEEFIERTRHSPEYASALYAASLRHKVQVGAIRGVFQSMVDLSDNGDLINKFINLPCPKMFMFGEQYASLSYLGHIQEQGVRLAEIPYCGHFPMYSNPSLMWKEIADFQKFAEEKNTLNI